MKILHIVKFEITHHENDANKYIVSVTHNYEQNLTQ